MPKGSHFTFLSACNDQGRESAREICVEEDPTVDREALHDQAGKVMLEFFDKGLR